MGQIKQYNDMAGYTADSQPTSSRVANITDGNLCKFDGVNVPTTDTPTFGDAVYYDDNNNKIAVRSNGYKRSSIPAGWVYKGVFLGYAKNGKWRTFLGNYASLPSLKYADVVQFRVTIPSESGTLTLGARFLGPENTTNISVEYEEGMELATDADTYEINNTTLCGRINAAIDELSGVSGTWWAYVKDDGNVILQRDTWGDYRHYMCSGSLTHVTWRDMPASDNYRKRNGKSTNYRGLLNISGGESYWKTNGRTLAANAVVHGEAGNTDPMKLTEFQESEFAADIRAYYGTYTEYLKGEYGIMPEMKVGVFSLPDGEALTAKYGPILAPTKNGGSKAVYPALNWAYQQGGHLMDAEEAVLIMDDANLAVTNSTQTKAGKVTLPNSTHRWIAQRYGVIYAWLFNGTNRYLSNSYVSYAFQVCAVALL